MASSTEIALECVGVRKAFGPRVVLDGVDLVVAAGGITAILGPSGEGKTTLLRLVAGFDSANGGTIAIRGQVVEGRGRPVPPHRRRVGYVPQEGALFPHLSVSSNVGFGLGRSADRAARIAECLELVGLAGAERARPHELSGGMQQRVALARAIAPRPDVVLLDEPFSSLDAGMRAQVRVEVCDMLRRAGATAVLVTHDQQEALSVADTVGVLLHGRIAQLDDPIRLYRRPVSLEVARFVGEAVEVEGRLVDGTVESPVGLLHPAEPVPRDGAVTVVIRPEQLVCSETAGAVSARVVGRSFLGPDAVVELAVGGLDAPVRARIDSWVLPEVGADVCVTVLGAVATFGAPLSEATMPGDDPTALRAVGSVGLPR
jgi:iron(III) transport system ATP-binding protein